MSQGLENIVAADTHLSHVDGSLGELIIHGRSLDDLLSSSIEEVAAELFSVHGIELPNGDGFRALLGQSRVSVYDEISPQLQSDSSTNMTPVDALRWHMAALGDGWGLDSLVKVAAAPAVILPAVLRQASGLDPVAPDEKAPHAGDILRMLRGEPAEENEVGALNTYLVTISDHGMNASTFAARVVASTGAGLNSAVVAGISALKGPLHGGAPGPIIDMLDQIAEAERAAEWIDRQLQSGKRLMGFGHRIYRVRDPRADALKSALSTLDPSSNPRTALAEAVERKALDALARYKPERVLQTNVEFYTAVLLERLGFPPSAFTGVFATGRTIGWLAHALEQRATGRLIRPQSNYVGPAYQRNEDVA